MSVPQHLVPQLQALANLDAIVQESCVRFTLLSSRLVRIEYDPSERFEDRPSQVFWHRRQAVPAFEVKESQRDLEIITPQLHLRYARGKAFSPKSLYITLNESGESWHFGDEDRGNLGGTVRTLDRVDGATQLEHGLFSRNGWTLLDDTNSLVFNEEGWLHPRDAHPQALDLYFFGYGQAYNECLQDYLKVTGRVPLIPRWALGNWWSRYWEYSQDELLALMDEFCSFEVPLSVCIIDMDWHLTATGNKSSGWTGYSWNRELFPEPDQLLSELHAKGLRVALNLHPAEGVHPHEEMYPEMAAHLGLDSQSKAPIPFDIADPQFTQAYFEVLHHPQEERGVDFWWLDWQQGELSSLPGLDPLWWLNHLHFYDSGRDGNKRPFIFSRWGGLGSHRYPIGFSGDTHVSWNSLAFQPYFTATAANVGFAWWSHDIGGHMFGIEEAELFTRWVQYGVFSPILRLHSTKNPYHERRPWGYDAETLRLTRRAMQLRQALIPYLYSMAWRFHRESRAPIAPMYHSYPEYEAAYHCPNQFAFGDQLIAAPHIRRRGEDTRLSRQVVWLPEGDWFDFFSGDYYPGDSWQALYGSLEDMPVFAKAGAIVPLAPRPTWGGIENPETLELHIFPGADGRFELYEDDGETTAYHNGAYALSRFALQWGENEAHFKIHPVQGDASFTPQERNYQLICKGLVEPDQIRVRRNGSPIEADIVYHAESRQLVVTNIVLKANEELSVRISSSQASLVSRRDRRRAGVLKMLELFRMESNAKHSLSTRLDELLTDPRVLGSYHVRLEETQLRALLEVITGCGVEHINNIGEQQFFILWNNHASEQASYLLSVDQAEVWDLHERIHAEQGPLPRFMTFNPRTQFPGSGWALNVDYDSLLTLNFSG